MLSSAMYLACNTSCRADESSFCAVISSTVFFRPDAELLVGELVALPGIAFPSPGGRVARLRRDGVEVGRLDLAEPVPFETELFETAVRGGDARLVDGRPVLAVREDRDADRERDILVEAVPDLTSRLESAARHVSRAEAGRKRNGGIESCARLSYPQLRPSRRPAAPVRSAAWRRAPSRRCRFWRAGPARRSLLPLRARQDSSPP